jgi:hypothetical protein
LGNVVAGEALRQAGSSQIVNTYVAMQGAVAAHTYDPAATTRSLGLYDEGTPNSYANYYTNGTPCYFNGVSGAGTYINFFNTNDWALNKWTTDQNLKPDVLFGYSFSAPDYYYRNLTELYFPNDTYELFSRVIQARSYALGAQPNVGGAFLTGTNYDQVSLPNVWPPDSATPPYSAHIWHSAEFRSDYAQRYQFWNAVLTQMKLK